MHILGCLNNAQKVVVGKAEVFPAEEILYNNEKKWETPCVCG